MPRHRYFSQLVFFIVLMTGLQTIVYASDSVVNVVVADVKREDIPVFVHSLGQLKAAQRVEISPQTSGQIASINFKNGASVGKGEPIVQLDNAIAKTDLEKAKTALALAQQKYERAKKVAQYLSSQELSSLLADVKTQKAVLNSSLAALQQRQVAAPFSGVLGTFHFSEGDYITAGQSLVSLYSTETLKLVYSIPDLYLENLKKGQSVYLHISQYPHKTFIGTVDYIAPIIDANTRTVEIHALVSNPATKPMAKTGQRVSLAPGMLAQVDHQLSVIKDALTVPEMAVSTDIHGDYVFILSGKEARKVYVKEGRRFHGRIQLLAGVTKGNQVIVAGQQKLQDHSQVSVQLPTTGA